MRPNRTGDLPLDARENEGIVQHEQRDRQDGRHAQDVQCVRQRNEAPFRRRQIEDVADDHAEGDEEWQDAQQQRQAGEEGLASLETQVEAGQQCKGGRQRVMRCDQVIAMGQLRKGRHSSGRLRKNRGFAGHPAPADISSAACMPAIMAGQFRKVPRPRRGLCLAAPCRRRRRRRAHTSSPRENRTDAS